MTKELSACFGGMEAFQQVPCSIKVKSVSELLENVTTLLSHGNRTLVSSPRKLTTLYLAIRIPLGFWVPYVQWDTEKAGCAQGDQNGERLGITQSAKGGVSASRRMS